MELIDKTAVVAEIIKIYDRNRSNGYIDICDEIDVILSFIDTLEVKEVDLDLEISLWAHELYEIPYDDVERMAKYFFELGLKAKGTEGICKISKTNCPNFDEAQGIPI